MTSTAAPVRKYWPSEDEVVPLPQISVDRVIDFTNDGVVVGPDLLKARLDIWQKVWNPSR
jgi:para-nitrobenzyl esterase